MEIAIDKLDKRSVMKITCILTKQFRVRLLLATLCFRLGTWILGCSVEVDQRHE